MPPMLPPQAVDLASRLFRLARLPKALFPRPTGAATRFWTHLPIDRIERSDVVGRLTWLLEGRPEAAGLPIASLASADRQVIRNGLDEIVRGAMSGGPELRGALLEAMSSDSRAAVTRLGWGDSVAYWTVDTLWGFGEVVPLAQPPYFKSLLWAMPDWAARVQKTSGPTAFRAMSDAFAPTLRDVNVAAVYEEATWQRLLPRLWLYWSSASVRHLHRQVSAGGSLGDHLLYLLPVRRALLRMKGGQHDPAAFEDFLLRFQQLAWKKDGARLFSGDQTGREMEKLKRQATALWEEIHRATEPRSPFQILDSKTIEPRLASFPEAWIDAALLRVKSNIGSERRPSFLPLDSDLLEILYLARGAARSAKMQPEFVAVLKANVPLDERVRRLRQLARQAASRTMPPVVPARTDRMPDFDPFGESVFSGLVLHPRLGVGRIGQEVPGNPLVEFAPTTGEGIRVLSSNLITTADPARWEAVMYQRATDRPELANLVAARALTHHLHPTDSPFPAQQALGGFSYGRLDDLLATTWDAGVNPDRLSKDLRLLGQKTGIDPVSFAHSLLIGKDPMHVISPLRTGGDFSDIEEDRLLRFFTPDRILALLRHRPWNEVWRAEGAEASTAVQWAGHYFPTYYRGEMPDNLTELYFRFRDREPAAIDEVTERLRPLVERWVRERINDCLLVPMQGSAPLREVAERLGHRVFYPWRPRPVDYGRGIEGRTSMEKLQMVEAGLGLELNAGVRLRGREVLIIDDNVTDAITYMVARRKLREAGAGRIGLVSLTRTIRHPDAFNWLYP